MYIVKVWFSKITMQLATRYYYIHIFSINPEGCRPSAYSMDRSVITNLRQTLIGVLAHITSGTDTFIYTSVDDVTILFALIAAFIKTK